MELELSFEGPNLATACILNVLQCMLDGYCEIKCIFTEYSKIPLKYTLAGNIWTHLLKKKRVLLFSTTLH